MTGRRLKLIAAQAVVVGALLIVVSLTLLRSENGAPLFDIDAPGSESPAGPAVEVRAGDARPGGDSETADPELDVGSAATALPGDDSVPSAPGPLRAPSPSAADESPAADQYGGSVARLELAIE